MKRKTKGMQRRVLCVVSALFFLVGCATGNVKFDSAMDKGDMNIYDTVAIKVINDVGENCPPDVSENLQAAAINQMKLEYSEAFKDVRPSPTGEENELLVEVHITKYKKGSRFARAMLIGLGASKVSTTVNMIDSSSERVVGSGKLDLTWAIGGAMGASKGVEDLVNDAGRKIADAIVAFKEGKENKQTKAKKY